ncbi:MAG TPA: HAMP domain-containing sensor histidine kinase [Acidimicrobiales bacterium]|jgi:signal transduction histidine kinase|nr:HAMP domain-containing sensor histidine kinase [Acidimicrobiales bacterium]
MAAVAVLGVAAAALIALRGSMSASNTAALLGWALGSAAVAGVVAAALLRVLRHARLAVQAGIAALAPVLAVTVSLVGSATTMFISSHDLRALLVVTVAAGTVGLVTALALGERVAAASTSLGHLAKRIGDDGAPSPTASGWATGAGAGTAAAATARRGPSELVGLAAELEAALARLAETRELAAAAEDSRRQLVAWVSHDLRTPLAGIRAMVEALEDGVVDDADTVARYYRTMGRETDRLAGLVDDLFELSRIQAGALNLDLEQMPLDELISDAVAGVSVAAGAKGIDVRGEVASPAPMVELSIPEMARVVRNLLDNAIRHTPRGGTVWVDAALDDDRQAALVSVRDACGGIPAPDLPRVFELAYRGDAARTPGDGGAGLGLAVARGLVEAHHGEISVRNEGQGCRFTIRLPLAASPAR